MENKQNHNINDGKVDLMPGLGKILDERSKKARLIEQSEIEEAINMARAKSIKSAKIKKTKKLVTISKAVFATALANLVIVGTTVGVIIGKRNEKASQVKDSIVMSIYKDDIKSNIVQRNTYQLYDGKGNCAYNTRGIAENVVGYIEENPNTLNDILYVVYDDMQYNKDQNLSEVYDNLNTIVNNNKEEYDDLYKKLAGSSSLEDYLMKEKLVDSDGKASIDKLENNFYNNMDYYIEHSNKNGYSRS